MYTHATIQLRQGYKVIGTVSKGKVAVAEATGCDELIVLDEMPGTAYEDYSSVDVAARVRIAVLTPSQC